ncbi:MAG: phospholipase D family protein [archaeon]|jgi:phosphatidylserine/phosphatidylglycerophosphate/cardiolipin synthase-like enzyme
MGFKNSSGVGKSGPSSSIIFLALLIIISVLLVFFARTDSYVPQLDYNLGLGVDSNSFKPIGFDLPIVAPQKANEVEVFFCPQDECAQQLIKKIDSSNKSVYIAIYSFTHDEIATALIRAKERGVEVKVVFDYDQSTNTSSDDEKLMAAGIPIARRNGSGYMHNKFTVIDGNVVATGSFNYSQNADTKNDENLVFIVSESIASKFKVDFDHLWDVSIKAS